jgi:ribosomal-protein-alanine N-acetyltransferase
VRAANREALQPFEPTWPENCLTRDFFQRRIQRQHRDWQHGCAYAFLIFEKFGDTLIGGININNVARGAAQYATLGYWLAQDWRGHGYMKEAGHLICEFAFDDLELHRLNAACVPENAPSQHMLLKLGFQREGYAPKFLQIDGQWRDHILYGLPVEDYINAQT